MAECTQYGTLIVSGSNIAEIDGEYTKAAVLLNGYSIWTKPVFDPSTNAGSKIFSSGSLWTLQYLVSPAYFSNSTSADCPIGLTWTKFFLAPPGAANNITVTGTAINTEPTFGLPADVVALITARFGSVANFLRLRNQGQV